MFWAWWNLIWKEEKKELLDVINSREMSRYSFKPWYITKVSQFENEFKGIIWSNQCIWMNSCTSALLTSLLALWIGPWDEVIVPWYTFIATIAAIIYTKALPIFAEIDNTLSIDPEDIIKRITPKTKAIIAVHMLWRPCNMDKINDIAKSRGIFVIEDVAQACWWSYKNRRLWSIWDIWTFSLNIFKLITAWDWWILTTNDKKIYMKAFAIHDHWFVPEKQRVTDDDSLIWLNFRMHELTWAVALAQTRKIDKILNRLRKIKKHLIKNIWKLENAEICKSNDPDWECATTIVIKFKTKEVAKNVAKELKIVTLIDSWKHYYWNMLQIINKRFPFNKWCPFYCKNSNESKIHYYKWMLPETDDILSRSIAIWIWVKDGYLGTWFWIEITSRKEEIEMCGKKIREIILKNI